MSCFEFIKLPVLTDGVLDRSSGTAANNHIYKRSESSSLCRKRCRGMMMWLTVAET